MSCGECVRWAKRPKPPRESWRWSTRYGFCRWPGLKPAPYWFDPNEERHLLLPDTAGEGCPAFRRPKAR